MINLPFLKTGKSGQFVNDIVIEEELKFRLQPETGFSDEFPRRVKRGEAILVRGNQKVLSPVDGIARLIENNELLGIRQDGAFPGSRKPVLKEFGYSEMIARLQECAVTSLDFSEPLADLLAKFRGREYFEIIFSPFTRTGDIDFSSLIMAKYNEEFQLLKGNLMTMFRDAVFQDFIGPGQLKYSYPHGIPDLFIREYTKAAPEDVMYFGPETVFHLIQALYYNIPFTRRHLAVYFQKDNGKKGPVKAYYLYNGQNLNLVKSGIPEKYKYFTFNSVYDRNEYHERGELLFHDIYKYSSLIFFTSVGEKSGECIECMNCTYLCPVSADPYGLVKNEKFNKSLCIECGICSTYCPSGIDFKGKIRDVE